MQVKSRRVLGITVLLGLALLVALLRNDTAPARPISLVTAPTAAPQFPATAQVDEATKEKVGNSFKLLPLTFVENKDIEDSRVKFFGRASGYSLFLTPTEFIVATRMPDLSTCVENCRERTSLRVLSTTLVGANPEAKIEGENKLETRSNFMKGNDPSKWRTDMVNYEKVRYHDIYPGIDAVYYGKQNCVEYDFIVAPGVDPSTILMQIGGADRIEMNMRGDAVLHMGFGAMTKHRPIAYQMVDGKREPVKAEYILKDGDKLAFNVGQYDKTRPLVIDPVLVYGTYIGDASETTDIILPPPALCENFFDRAFAVAVDSQGNAYVTGQTNSPSFDLVGSFPRILNNYTGIPVTFTEPFDIYVVKLNPSGSGAVYATWFGGTDFDTMPVYDECARGIAVQSNGSVVVTGITNGINFPLFVPVISGGGGQTDAFVTKLTPAGNGFVYSFTIGGSAIDQGLSAAVDNNGNAYVAGFTASNDFPLIRPFIGGDIWHGGTEGFVMKVSNTGDLIAYTAYIGGMGNDTANGVSTDSQGNLYVTGQTASADFPVATAFQDQLIGATDAYVMKLDPSGANVLFSTYLGGAGDESGAAVAVDGQGQISLTGFTSSADYPVQNATQGTYGGGATDAFFSRFNPTATALSFSTFIGGNQADAGRAITVDGDGYVYIAGNTNSPNLPQTPFNSFQSSFAGGASDAFITKYNPLSATDATQTRLYATYLGTNNDDDGNGIAADNNGNAYVVGSTLGATIGTVGSFNTLDGEDVDAFATKFADSAPRITSAKFIQGVLNQAFSYQITATNSPTSFNASGLSAIGGLTVDTGSGLISGIPANQGSYVVTISATNLAGTAIVPLIISINSTVPQVLSQADVGVATVPYTYRISATQNPTSFGASVTAPFTGALSAIGLTVDTQSGDISGTPTSTGTFTIQLSATNNIGTGFGSLLLTINPAPPVITSSATANGTVGAPFQYIIAATNNPASFAATVTAPVAGPLSSIGLALNTTTGVISGTPTVAAVHTIQMTASNAGGTSTPVNLQLTVDTKPVINSALTLTATVGVPIPVYTITALNGPTSFGASNLPPGFAVNTGNGQITGTPLFAGVFNVIISATNGAGIGTAVLVITINPPAPVITNSPTMSVPVGFELTLQIQATNSPQSYGATITASNNPAVAIGPITNLGLAIDALGAITGAPNNVGVFTIQLSATNGSGTGTLDLILTVVASAPSITSAGTDTAAINLPYSYQITAIGTVVTYTAVIVSSNNPAVPAGPLTGLGLAVNATTGLISGTPNGNGVYTIQLGATNGAGTGNKDLVLTVTADAPVITSALQDNAVVNVPYTYLITAVGSPTITFSSPDLPANNLTLNGAVISGTPTQEGIMNVTIRASNGIPPDDVRVLKINVISSGGASGDGDGDGFPNDLETALGTDPASGTSTPLGGQNAGTPTVINITSMQIKLNFATAGKDSIAVKGDIEVPTTFLEANTPVTVVVGGVVSTYTLSSRGSAKSGNNKFSLKSGKPHGPTKTAKFNLSQKGSFAAALADEGLTGEADVKDESNTVNVYFLLNDQLFQSNKLLSFTAKRLKTGRAIQPRL